MLPSSVRYVKNGKGGKWWSAAKRENQIHAGWRSVPEALLKHPDYDQILPLCANRQDCNALQTLLDNPSQHLWITFQDDCLWWCLVDDGVTVYEGESEDRGHFSLQCKEGNGWSNRSQLNKTLAISDLPGPVTSVAGFRATVCRPGSGRPEVTEQILRVIRGETNPLVLTGRDARHAYEQAVAAMLTKIGWQDFELLVSLLLERTGWIRSSELGKTRKSIDLDVENWASEERAFVQVKATAAQDELDDYIEQFENAPHYSRMIFAVHTPQGDLNTGGRKTVHLWTGKKLSELVVRLGLGGWIESKIA